MPLTRRIREVLGSAGSEQRYAYQCNVCQATFESDHATAAEAGCPHCGANNVRERLKE